MRKRSLRIAGLVMLALVTGLTMASAASAAFSIEDFSVSSTSSLAGAHPDLTTNLTFSTTSPNSFQTFPDGNVRDVTVELPPGLLGNPNAVPQCAQADFVATRCPPASQIGVADVQLIYPAGFALPSSLAVFNMEPRNDEETAEIAFAAGSLTAVHLVVSVRTDSDYGVTASSIGTSRIFGIGSAALHLWGIPADPSHDGARKDMTGLPVPPSQLARIPYLTNPTSCNGPLKFTASANSYQTPTTFQHAEAEPHRSPVVTQCRSRRGSLSSQPRPPPACRRAITRF